MRALVSTSDKTGLIEFLKPLVAQGTITSIVSTGGTYVYLKNNNFTVVEVSEITQFPEVLDGRVKTLHPLIHMGLLADKDNVEHEAQMKEQKALPFDMVVGNLYPFEKTAVSADSTFDELIENIDIGGPSFLRASAKNFKSVIVLSSPDDYAWVLKKLIDKSLTFEDKKKLAIKVFSLTAYYDSLIVEKLCDDKSILEYLNIPLKKKLQLRYGENAHQKACWYMNPLKAASLNDVEIHQGKELSYNNILDLDAALNLVKLFESAACVAVKHNNPCGAAISENIFSAAQKAIKSDPKSIFGGIVAFNQEVDLKTCELFKDIFLECIVAPVFSSEALEFLTSKKNLRALSFKKNNLTNICNQSNLNYNNVKSISGGVLLQQEDTFKTSDWSFLGTSPDSALLADMIFGEKIAAALKSNAIAIVVRGQTVGLGMGQVNRVDAVKQAIERMLDCQKRLDFDLAEAVLISDAFFPFADSIELIAHYGIKWILQPGGSVQDEKVIESALKNKINMIISKRRHFKH